MAAYVSADAHYSMEKAANLLGIGTENLIRIPVNRCGEMDAAVFGRKLETALDKGVCPFFVSGTTGTTVRGTWDKNRLFLRLLLGREKDAVSHLSAVYLGAAALSLVYFFYRSA